MNSIHELIYKDSHNMDSILSGSINLVVTSPPYPMFDMWDTLFSSNNDIATALKEGDGRKAYILIHEDVVPKRRKRFEQKRLNNMTIN
ncbi:MAG: hypothetical protein ACTSPB_06745 [Candidatus Thorarchaeota archaeon]